MQTYPYLEIRMMSRHHTDSPSCEPLSIRAVNCRSVCVDLIPQTTAYYDACVERGKIASQNKGSLFSTLCDSNANAFLDQVKTHGATPELMGKIGKDFTKDHMAQALSDRGSSKDDLLKAASGGSSNNCWIASTAVAATAAAAGA